MGSHGIPIQTQFHSLESKILHERGEVGVLRSRRDGTKELEEEIKKRWEEYQSTLQHMNIYLQYRMNKSLQERQGLHTQAGGVQCRADE
ncbi:hypothetical protein QJS10_CPB19g01770 [Acorus calamus]|uniref:Uncharacterized protein n=1 Tax=Acorus calamus TaxID=4465 RepID=A0AAV9CJ29_ACOCL|nr:hypothetical protein QJS10_CPB19g01770 [Acorus calamus]